MPAPGPNPALPGIKRTTNFQAHEGGTWISPTILIAKNLHPRTGYLTLRINETLDFDGVLQEVVESART